MEVMKHRELDYVIEHPQSFDKDKKYPLVIYLHGAGGRGRDITVIQNHSFFKHSDAFCADVIRVAPQCYADSWFDIFEQLQDFINSMIELDCVDSTRVYVIGASMGGYTTWQIAMTRPEWFAAIVPICGGGMYWNGERLKHMGVWAFHGSDDKTVLCRESEIMVEKINKRGGNAKLTIYPGVPHNAWEPTFKSAEMWKWLFEQRNHHVQTRTEYNDVSKYG